MPTLTETAIATKKKREIKLVGIDMYLITEKGSRDFRKQTWAEAPAVIEGKTASGLVAKPEKEWRAFFMECEYEEAGKPFFLSTQIRMEEAGK